jgi:hypothetical protein
MEKNEKKRGACVPVTARGGRLAIRGDSPGEFNHSRGFSILARRLTFACEIIK